MTDIDEQRRSQKPKLSRKNLSDNGIEFDEWICPIDLNKDNGSVLPAHVDSLRRALLDFGRSIPRRHENDLEKEYEARLRKLKEPGECTYAIGLTKLTNNCRKGRPM